MPMPMAYRVAQADFDRFIEDACRELDAPTSNVTYTAVQAAFVVFRRRLSVEQAITFAQVLPPILRALFLDTWDLSEARRPFASMADLNAELRSFRRDHNFAGDQAIEAVGRALRRACDDRDFERALSAISPDAMWFWGVAPRSNNGAS